MIDTTHTPPPVPLDSTFKYGVGSPKLIWAPGEQLYSLAGDGKLLPFFTVYWSGHLGSLFSFLYRNDRMLDSLEFQKIIIEDKKIKKFNTMDHKCLV